MPRQPSGSDENGNWSSFQLANSAPPLSVTGSAIAPSARMQVPCRKGRMFSVCIGNAGSSRRSITNCSSACTYTSRTSAQQSRPRAPRLFGFCNVSGVSHAKIDEVTLNALRTRQSLVKGERLVRTEVRAVLLLVVWGHGTSTNGKDDVGSEATLTMR